MKKKYDIKNLTFGDRIKRVRQALLISQKDFAKKIGVAAGVVCDIESQKFNPGFGFLMKMNEAFKISPSYILLGTGPMFITEDEEGAPEQIYGIYRDSVNEVVSYMKKSPIVRLAVINFAKHFIQSSKEIVDLDIKMNAVAPGNGAGDEAETDEGTK